jgi:hypothetical protein
VVTGPTGGSLTLQPDGSFTYAPRSSSTRTDSFTYRATDPQGLISSTATVTLTITQVACGPRPSVAVTTSVANGALLATVSASDTDAPTNNRLQSIQFGELQNATVTLNGQPVASGQTVTLPANTTSQSFTVRRITAGKATTVPFTVVDGCGSWKTFVGGGTAAGF